jgi:hypothetical protein
MEYLRALDAHAALNAELDREVDFRLIKEKNLELAEIDL